MSNHMMKLLMINQNAPDQMMNAWLVDRFDETTMVDGTIDLTFVLFDDRVRLGVFGGWVTSRPEEAIESLIQPGIVSALSLLRLCR